MAAIAANKYHQSMWGEIDRLLRNCFIGSSILGVVLLIMVFVVPKPIPEEATIEQLPERVARLILEKPKAKAPALPTPEKVVMEQPKVEPRKQPETKPKPRRRTSKPKVAENIGKAGREKAQKEVTQNLAQVTGSLDKVMDNLEKSLPAATDDAGDKKPTKRRRRVRGGRKSSQVASVGGVTGISDADVSSSAIDGEGISIAAITDIAVSDDGGDPSSPGSSASASGGSNNYRSNESLLAAVRRYAPGIQFCYDNELKKDPSLRGKLVVNITVEANGTVSGVDVVDDTLGSGAVRNCVLAQIRGWKLPEIPEGVVSFKAPFVFTPPN